MAGTAVAALVPVPVAAPPIAASMALPPQCSGTAPIRCHFDVSPGSYDVTVDLGGPVRATNTSMSVEARRQLLPVNVRGATVAANYGDSGESSGSFLAGSALFPRMKPLIRSGGLLFIQFGHNDEDTTQTAFRNRGVDLPAVIRALGRSTGVPVIDLTAKSRALVEPLDPSASQRLHLTATINFQVTDNTHFSVHGATEMANRVVQGVRELNLPLAGHPRAEQFTVDQIAL